MVFIVAIDGPVGSGKSSVAKAVALELGLAYVDTGAIYRVLALAALEAKISWLAPMALADLAESLEISFLPSPNGQKTLMNKIDVSHKIRTEEISQGSSKVSQYVEVRSRLLALQRRLGEESESGSVLEGRDIGTVVFPHADIKFFLNASDEERARRRFLELTQRSEDAVYATVLAGLKERDARDAKRENAPLFAAPDAILINTDSLTQRQVIEQIKNQVKKVYQK
jgi:CMP/dCMP kinase